MAATKAIARQLAANAAAPIPASPLRVGQEDGLDGDPKKAQALVE
jgi:hypothetical protein